MMRVLFLCTGNSARSVLGECLLNHLGHGRFEAFSAGSQPTGKVNPLALETLQSHGVSSAGVRSKSWDEFGLQGVESSVDIILTVCDGAADEACPVWPGHPVTAHWGLADPAAVTGDQAAQARAFETAFAILRTRIEALLGLDPEALKGPTGPAQLAEIGRLMPVFPDS
jgi:protein-tyrosine-phosphatase